MPLRTTSGWIWHTALGIMVGTVLLGAVPGPSAEALSAPPRLPAYLGATKFTVAGNFQGTWRGGPVALNGDGTVLVVGAPSPSFDVPGAAYVFTRSGPTDPRFEQTATLAPSDGAPGDDFGTSVAVSADGGTIVVGRKSVSRGQAGSTATYVFMRPASGWAHTSETARLTGVSVERFAEFGSAVAISADGATILVAATGSTMRGAVYVYARPEDGWATTTQTARLTTTDNLTQASYGFRLALSGDGATIAVASPAQSWPGYTSTVYVFTRPADDWSDSMPTAKLTVSGADPFSFAKAVAISRDGTMIAVGSSMEDQAAGAVFVFTRGAAWTSATQAVKLAPSTTFDNQRVGITVAVSNDGATIAAGASSLSLGGRTDIGAVYIFARDGAAWRAGEPYDRLMPADVPNQGQLGLHLTLSGDGGTLVATAFDTPPGAQFASSSAAYVFRAATEALFIPQVMR